MDTGTKTGIGAAEAASKRVVQKTAEATGDLKIADKITPADKTKSKKKKDKESIKDKKFTYHQKKIVNNR